ncbi:replication factor a protein 3 protein [Besnoitia besnoiti]|uniref:Replication factor a protein 3 protein n=1 Tax=Besnoitia besnoiti TaxID=94643 RepID=A0A2A9M9E8_BESBE|nr:replication factor a protein 3 protein [Besnoitia besnoiti]PFH32941.1 replication factor a protein 3 protein [Besnoitia besnoiti]
MAPAVYCRSLPFAHLAQHVGATVSLTGRVKQVEEGIVILQTCDGSCVKCQLATEAPPCKFLKVTGRVQENLTLVQHENHVLVPLGDELDMGLARDVAYVTKHPLFSTLFEAVA